MNLDLVVFDMAGTTIEDGDSVNLCLRDALADGGFEASRDEINRLMGLPKPEAIRIVLESRAVTGDITVRVASIHRDFTARMTRFYETDPSVYAVPGATSWFSTLRRAGVKVALDTGFSRPIANTLLARLGWNQPEVLDATITSDEVARGRPFPDMIHALMRRWGLRDPRRVAKVGDTPSDLEEGTSAGCGLVIGVCWGTHTRNQLACYRHTHLLDRPAEMLAALGF